MQIDVNVNMTFEIDDDVLEAFIDELVEDVEDEDDNRDEYVDEAVQNLAEYYLEGAEFLPDAGRAWVCCVHDAAVI